MTAQRLSKVIDEINTGDLLAFKMDRYKGMTSLFSYLYHRIGRAEFSHVGIATKLEGRLYITEAVPPRVQLLPISHLKDFYLISTDIECSHESMIKYLDDVIGTKYGIIDAITHYLGMDRTEDSIYCSELCSEFYFNAGYLHETESGHTPDKIVRAVLERSNVAEPRYIFVDKGNLI